MARRVLVLMLMLVTLLTTACALDLIRLRASDVINEASLPEPVACVSEIVPTAIPTPSPTPTPTPTVSAGMLALRDRLASAIDKSGIDAAVAVTDLRTGESINVNGDEPRHAGCTLNWFVLLSNVVDIQNGTTAESEVGSLISRTIYGSNPVTAHDLLIRTGGGNLEVGVLKVRRLLANLGLRHSIFDHPPGYSEEYTLHGDDNVVTANDMNQALAAFWRGEVVDQQWRDYLLDKMTNVKPGLQYLLATGVGERARVSHKNGFTWFPGGWVDNDIGIVTFDSAGATRAYAISFYSQDVTWEYADVPLGQSVSQMVWQYFAERYP